MNQAAQKIAEHGKVQKQHAGNGAPVQGNEVFGTVNLTRDNSNITGYLMTDGTCQFTIGGETLQYATLRDAWTGWQSHAADELNLE